MAEDVEGGASAASRAGDGEVVGPDSFITSRSIKVATNSAARAVVVFFLAAAVVSAEVPPDLANAVDFQKKNKAALVAKLQQRANYQRQERNADGAKQTKKLADAVRSNKILVLPPMGEAGDLPGTVDIEEVIEKTDDGYRIETSLPRLEARTGVDVRTGAQVAMPGMGNEFIYYPAKIYVTTQRELKKGERINVRRTQDGYAEISADELEEAAKLLKKN